MSFFARIENAVLALVVWSLVMLCLLYVYRLPAMAKHKVSLVKIAVKGTEAYRTESAKMPIQAAQVAENYNHLMEQPTIFYALVLCIVVHSDGRYRADATLLADAWLYVALRILHSLIQSFYNRVPLRFTVFAGASLVLSHMALTVVARELLR